jgi:protein-disulfide isomerase
MVEVINFSDARIKKPFNLWAVVSAILFIALIVVLVFPSSIGISGNVIGSSNVGTKTIDFINNELLQSGNATLSSVADIGSMYEVNVTYNGNIIPTYVTKDGKYFMQGALSMDTKAASSNTAASQQPVNVTKSDKPVVNAYVFAYCPYGLQFEKALSPVYNLLKDKADINIVYIGAMHGDFERVESLRQLCVLKNYGKDTLWNYLNKFAANTSISSCSGDATCLSPILSNIMSSLSIDSAKIDACMSSDATALYNADTAAASSAGVTGSPTFKINGAEVSVARSPAAIEQAICDAFTTAPAECSQALSSTAASAGFGSSSSTATAASCGA